MIRRAFHITYKAARRIVVGVVGATVVLIGVIMLAGIVVNNAIVLVDLINQLRGQGVERMEAIMEAGKARLRPIRPPTARKVGPRDSISK